MTSLFVPPYVSVIAKSNLVMIHQPDRRRSLRSQVNWPKKGFYSKNKYFSKPIYLLKMKLFLDNNPILVTLNFLLFLKCLFYSYLQRGQTIVPARRALS